MGRKQHNEPPAAEESPVFVNVCPLCMQSETQCLWYILELSLPRTATRRALSFVTLTFSTETSEVLSY